MTTKQLFEDVTKLVADPHTTILTHDKVRSAKIIMSIYLHLCEKFKIDEDHSAIIFKDDLDALVDAIPFEIMEIIKDE